MSLPTPDGAERTPSTAARAPEATVRLEAGLVARGLEIALAVSWMLARYALLRLTVLVTADDDAVGLAARDHLRGRLLRETLERLGATFIKLGQVMSTRPDLFAPPIIEELERLQDSLPAFPGARGVIERELGPKASRLAELDDTPIAAASVAQVHRGVLDDGTEVALKVLRPDVRALAERDGRILLVFAHALMAVSGAARHAELADHLAHFLDGVVRQTDLRIEAANYAQFRSNFRRVKKVRFPRVFDELSSEHVLVMEFVRGEKVSPSTRDRFPEVPARLRDAFLKMCFDDGFLHADLHPGNFVLEADGTICIFDVGLTKQLSDELLEHYIDFNRCLAMGDVDDFMHHLRTYHRYIEGSVDWAELERDVTAFATEFRAMSAKELEFRTLIDRVFGVARKHGVRPIPDMTLMMVGLVTAEGIGKQLEPDASSFQEVTNYLIPVLARRNLLTEKMLLAASSLALRS